MVLSVQEKKTIVSQLSNINHDALSVVVANPCKIAVNEMNKLRKSGRESGVHMQVVRNTLLRRVVKNTSFDCLKDLFVGSSLIAYSLEHPGAAARLLKKFAEKNTDFEIKSISFEGKLIPLSKIDSLASLPTYKEALAILMSTMKESAAGKLACTLSAIKNKKAVS